MSLLLKALNKAEGEEGREPVASSASVDFDTIGAGATADKAGGFAPGGGGSGGVEEKRQQIVSATRVFGAGESEKKARGFFLKSVVGLVVLAVLGGAGYFGLESSGISVSGLIGVDIAGLFGKQKEAKIQTGDSGRPVLAATSESRLLLPQPGIDVQSDINFAALRPQNQGPGSLPESRDDYNNRIAIITGFNIDKESKSEESVVVEESDENLSQTDLEYDADVETFSAESSREQKARLDAITPSDSRLGGVVVRVAAVETEEAPALEKGVKTDDVKVESSKTEQKAEEKFVDSVEISASENGQDRKRMLNRARGLYRDGAYAEAEAVYKNILRHSPTSVDALRGIAQLAIATRRYQLAAVTYLKILNLYPGDPFAVSGLTNLGGDSLDAYEVERSLKDLIGKNPDLDGGIYFSLGNTYARQQRWIDSQEAYFQAFSQEPGNPDYAFNLAVTLDYLNKPKLALNYYNEAVRLAKKSKLSGFNVSVAEARISVLQGN